MIKLLKLSELDRQKWEELLSASPVATFSHTAEWAQLWEESYAFFKSYFLVDVAADGNYRVGLPFVRARKGLDNYYSMPMGSYGGVVSTPSFENSANLYAEWMERANRARTERLMVFTEREEAALINLGFSSKKLLTHTVELSADYPFRLSRSTKKDIERSRRAGFSLERLEKKQQLADFFTFSGRGRKKDFYTKRFYEKIFERLVPPGQAAWFCARKKSVLAAYQICFLFKEKITFWDTDFDPRFSESGPGYFLKDQILSWAQEVGFKEAEFGQTPQGAKGALEFKERMGGEARPTFEYTYTTPLKRKLRSVFEKIRGRA